MPWGDIEALAAVQRELDCDILVSGQTHQSSITQMDGRCLINPGSLTGAFSGTASAPRPSFCLLSIQGEETEAFLYELVNDEVQVRSCPLNLKK